MYDEEHTNGESVPCWYAGHASEDGQRELPVRAVDVAVIGAGIAGLSTAYHLLEAGRSVVVVDKAAVGAGETGRTTTHLSNALDDHYYMLERVHGEDGARVAAESHAAAIDSIERIAAREGIRCDFARVDGYLYVEPDESVRELERELAAARRAGLDVSMIDRAPVPYATGPALRFANQAQMDPMAYLTGLAHAVIRRGGVIVTGQRVNAIEEGRPVHVRLADGSRLTAGALVVATNTPINDMFAIHTKQAAYRTYVIGVEVPTGLVPRALVWDTHDPYHYLRLASDDLWIVGGEDHKTGHTQNPEQSWGRLEQWLRERVPSAVEVRFRWSGQVLEPFDGLAFIGRNPGRSDNVFIVTGDSGNGMTHGALAGLMLSELVQGKDHPWARVYAPSRKIKRLSPLREYVVENASVAKHYTDWLRPGLTDGDGIEPGQGAVVRRGVQKIAVYVDDAGERHECKAMCPHLGCVVAWNRAERSWDCPCHGSRFDPYGRVMNGPATRDLSPVEPEPAPLEQPHPPGASAE